jgi:hypothetical protein
MPLIRETLAANANFGFENYAATKLTQVVKQNFTQDDIQIRRFSTFELEACTGRAGPRAPGLAGKDFKK